MKSGNRMANAVGERRLRPCAAAVGRCALHDSLGGASQHPERAVGALDDHVFVPVGIWKLHATAPFPSHALVAGDEDIGPAVRVQFLECAFEGTEAPALIERDRHHPFAGRKHGRLVERDAVPDSSRIGPRGLLCIRVFTY